MARTERGASAVEFAIVLPVLFLVIAGIVDFGRYFFTQIQLTNAAREGARAAVVLPSPAASDMTAITQRALAGAAGVPGAAASVIATCPAPSPSYATVRVTATFDWIIMKPAIQMIGGNWGLNGPVVANGVMQCGG
ncbi:TadE/TadG family type IV pilus assembly protein [Terrabacter sp. GCM10028922]|uniref:TadE/TadG family type IV pilus assembly protein n=1 Tax=Terrabacter sp. GCM10028922 TaxID=3273428 RepID=UPI00361A5149